MDFINQLFTELDHYDSWTIIAFLTGAYLLGLLTSWIIGSGRRKYKRLLAEREKELSTLKIEHATFKEQYELKDADVKRLEYEAESMIARIADLENDKKTLDDKWYAATTEVEELNARITADHVTIEGLKRQVTVLQEQNDQLEQDLEQEAEAVNEIMALQSSYAATKNKLAILEEKLTEVDTEKYNELYAKFNRLEEENANLKMIAGKLQKLENENADLKSIAAKIQQLESENAWLKNLGDKFSDIESAGIGLKVLEDKLDMLSRQNAVLRDEIEEMRSHQHYGRPEESYAGEDRTVFEHASTHIVQEHDDVPLVVVPKESKADFDKNLSAKLEREWKQDRDDLTKIDGIGTLIEEKLNTIGVFTYAQIAGMNNADLEEVSRLIRFFPGRAVRDDWAGQAYRLMQDNQYANKSFVPSAEQDFTVIEGISPEVETILRNANINTLEDLADADVVRLRNLLMMAEEDGDPATWPEQARLAAEGKWDELRGLQDLPVG